VNRASDLRLQSHVDNMVELCALIVENIGQLDADALEQRLGGTCMSGVHAADCLRWTAQRMATVIRAEHSRHRRECADPRLSPGQAPAYAGVKDR
jgi:hypothetical protein